MEPLLFRDFRRRGVFLRAGLHGLYLENVRAHILGDHSREDFFNFGYSFAFSVRRAFNMRQFYYMRGGSLCPMLSFMIGYAFLLWHAS